MDRLTVSRKCCWCHIVDCRNALVGRGQAKEQVRLKIKDFLDYCNAEHHGKRDDSPL